MGRVASEGPSWVRLNATRSAVTCDRSRSEQDRNPIEPTANTHDEHLSIDSKERDRNAAQLEIVSIWRFERKQNGQSQLSDGN